MKCGPELLTFGHSMTKYPSLSSRLWRLPANMRLNCDFRQERPYLRRRPFGDARYIHCSSIKAGSHRNVNGSYVELRSPIFFASSWPQTCGSLTGLVTDGRLCSQNFSCSLHYRLTQSRTTSRSTSPRFWRLGQTFKIVVGGCSRDLCPTSDTFIGSLCSKRYCIVTSCPETVG